MDKMIWTKEDTKDLIGILKDIKSQVGLVSSSTIQGMLEDVIKVANEKKNLFK